MPTIDPNIMRAIAVMHALRLYAKAHIIPNRAYTPAAMMRDASEITGKKFKARDYIGAADAIKAKLDIERDAIL